MDKYSTFGKIDYILKLRRGQKSIRMHIDPKGDLVISCSPIISESQIEKFLSSNIGWIEKHSSMLEKHQYEEGELIPYWGNNYSLKLEEGRRKVKTESNNIVVRVKDTSDREKIRKALYLFYKESLSAYVINRTEYWCRQINVRIPETVITNSKSRWGVCYYRQNKIKVSAMTACLPEELVDMTVLHEVCHLKYNDHSQRFWSLMQHLMPDLERRKAILKEIDRNSSIHSLF